LLNFLYPKDVCDFSKYNNVEQTFVSNDSNDCWSFEWLLDTIGIDYRNTSNNKSKNFIKFNILFPTEYLDLQYLPDSVWSYLTHNDNTFLLLYQATEATTCYYWNYRWNKLKNFLLEKKIPPEKVFYISGDLNAIDNHKIHNDNYWSKAKVLGIDIFEMMHLYRHMQNSQKNYKDIIDLHNTSQKTKKFLNLNKRMRPNKQALIYYLHKNKLLEDSKVSALWHESKVISSSEFSSYNFDKSDYDDFVKIAGRQLILDDYGNDQHSEPSLYLESMYSLVSETYTGSTVKFITEKTYKPILMGHPFLVHGTSGTLQHLKKIGYETFSEIFDESYDMHSDPKKQLKIIIENSKRDISINKDIMEKCKHNQNLFLKQPSKKIVKKQLENFLL